MLVVEQFEVVLAMIPSRGDASALTKIRESNQESETKNGEQTPLSAIKDGGKGQSSGGGTDAVAVADLESTVAVGGINCTQQNCSENIHFYMTIFMVLRRAFSKTKVVSNDNTASGRSP